MPDTAAMPGATPAGVDAIDRDIFQHQVISIAEEMSMALRRASYSSIIWDMYDYATGILLPNGDMIAQAQTIPAQLGIMSTAVHHMFKAFPLATWREGDVIICNDPYRGCTHTPDMVLFSPIMVDGEVIAIASTIAHHVDIGGKVPGTEAPDSTEIYQEGLIIPPLKLYEAGRPNETLFSLIASNVRDPRANLGDLRAQVAGCRTAERRVAELFRRHGKARFEALCQASLDYTETYIRSALKATNDGHGHAHVLIEDGDDGPDLVRIEVDARIENDTLILDFTGTSPQRDNALNCPASATISMVHYAVKAVFAPDLPQNAGCDRPVVLRIPEGSMLAPKHPAAVSVRHLSQQALADAVLKALAPLSPKTAAAGCHVSFPSFVFAAVDDRPGLGHNAPGALCIVPEIMGGGMGAHASGDGMAAIDTHGGNCALLSAEIMESTGPIRVLSQFVVAGSGGAGRHRGGLALRREFEILAETGVLTGYLQQTRPETAPWGYAGGSPGMVGSMTLIRDGEARSLGSKWVNVKVRRGDRLAFQGAGGGGWGDAAERDPDLAAADVANGFV